MKKILITGAAGFIGYHTAKALCEAGHDVVGIDNLNDYYDPSLKKARLAELQPFENFEFRKIDLCDRDKIAMLFNDFRPEIVLNLAAQAGVRYSLEHPHAYTDSNITGFLNILEGARHYPVEHLIYASSSSVYGANEKVPFSVSDPVDHPISLYAATKKSNELMAHCYAHLYDISMTGLRFFTVYGPWGRPDMAYFKFVKALYEGAPIDVYNQGDMQRDFTYIDDIVAAIMKLLENNNDTYRLFNIGHHKPEELMDMIGILEELTGCEARENFMPMQPGDVKSTFADIDDLDAAIGFRPSTSLRDGLSKFVDWYKGYYDVGLNSREKA